MARVMLSNWAGLSCPPNTHRPMYTRATATPQCPQNGARWPNGSQGKGDMGRQLPHTSHFLWQDPIGVSSATKRLTKVRSLLGIELGHSSSCSGWRLEGVARPVYKGLHGPCFLVARLYNTQASRMAVPRFCALSRGRSLCFVESDGVNRLWCQMHNAELCSLSLGAPQKMQLNAVPGQGQGQGHHTTNEGPNLESELGGILEERLFWGSKRSTQCARNARTPSLSQHLGPFDHVRPGVPA